ncbi:MAG TPA: FecR domain-containing protein [Verrucomicrobiae bacterium]|jgi:Tfp pilus assembly protein PilF|nr:FecR domain-containing protein [Verrucomicrobiae bacterium]
MQPDLKADHRNMTTARKFAGSVWPCLALATCFSGAAAISARAADTETGAQEIRIIELQGQVEVLPVGASTWTLTQTNQVLHPSDRLRSGSNSRVTLRWSDESIVPFGALTEIEILPADASGNLAGLHVVRGIVSFFHRDKPGRIKVITHGAVAGIEGTEFVMEVSETNGAEHTVVSVVDGKVKLSNADGELTLTNLQQGIADTGHAPARTAGFIANNILQWCFYYPAVLDLNDLEFAAEDERVLHESLSAYRAGDLLAALANYPAAQSPASDAAKIYHAAVLLAVGQVSETEAVLASIQKPDSAAKSSHLAEALRTLIAAVKRQSLSNRPAPELATELLAESYYEQSRANGESSLTSALKLAKQAAARSPQFGYAWERVAELEFGFGRTAQSLAALNQSLALAPRNAQGLALKGFVEAARNNTREAASWFDRALAVDAALGNAWLGRGLCRIKQGDLSRGRTDLLTAAALEPQRALLRSYLGKAYADSGDDARAARELQLSLKLDPSDPTGWLYLALLKQQENKINEAVGDLQQSQERNDDRSVFRSHMLLDQDRAVGSANLATMYRDLGMTDVSVREASKAVTSDYANDSAHLFLSDAYNDLRDPTQFNLRYETVWFNELLLANILAPLGGGRLSQGVSQQEYSRLFEADGIHFADTTEYRTDGMYHQLASLYGTEGKTAYSLDLDYHHNSGFRINNALNDIEFNTTIKQQVTDADTALLLVQYQDYHSGDNFQYYNQSSARPFFNFNEQQQPIVVGAWHREWAPGIHTLLLGGRLVDQQQFSDRGANQLLLAQDGTGNVTSTDVEPFNVDYHNQFEIYTGELNQIFEFERVNLSLGARFQAGTFDSQNTFGVSPGLVPFLFPTTDDTTSDDSHFRRTTGYGYLTVEPVDHLWLTGGATYDDISYPLNFRNPPFTGGEDHRSQLGPKAGIVWEPISEVAVRGIYARSLGGVSLDESYRLEPTQLAGFPQTFRSLIPESLYGSIAAPEFEVYGGALDLKFSSRTYAGFELEELNSKVRRDVGAYSLEQGFAPYVSDSTAEYLDYRELAFSANINQLLGDQFVVGGGYKLDRVRLGDTLPEIPIAALATASQEYGATLHETTGYILFNHPSGFFARVDATWYRQQNSANSAFIGAGPGDSFVQENIYAGWRFLDRRIEARFGLLDLSGGGYQLSPLNTYQELPRKRTFMARLNFVF